MDGESPSRWLSANVRILFRRIEKLEDLLAARTFRFNPEAPEFVPKSSLCLDDLIQPTSICNAEFANLIYNLYVENQPRSMHAENPHFTDKYSRAENPEIIQNTIQCRGDAADEERDSMGYDANEQDAADINTARPNLLSAWYCDCEDVPSTDNFLQLSNCAKHVPRNDDDEQYEYGDTETQAFDADTSDFFPDQFIAPDEAREQYEFHDVMKQTIDAVASDFSPRQFFDPDDTLAAEVFDDASDLSPHQSIAPDEARDPMCSDDNELDATNYDAARSKILLAETHAIDDEPHEYDDVETLDNDFLQSRVARLADLIRRRRDAAPQTYAAPQILPTADSMVAVPQQYQFFRDLMVSNDDDECSSSSCTSEGMPDLIPADGNGCEDDAEQYDYDSDYDSEVERMEHYLMSIDAWDDDEQYVDEQYDCDSVAYGERENHLRSMNR